MLEVEDRQAEYFSANSPLYDRELVEALAQDDPHALSALLSLTRLVAQADFTFWARAYDHAIEVTSHLGAKHSGFGFALLRGHGMGGVAAFGKPMVEDDYRNSPYRAPSVSEVVDAEEVRSMIALPVCYYPTPERSAPIAAVLYAARRTVNPFSQAERLLMQRQVNILGQLAREKRSPSYPSLQHLSDHKAVWHNLVLHANRIEEVEVWAEQLIKGRVIVTNSEGSPYVFAHVEELEQMRAAESGQPSTTLVLSLTALGVHLPGQVYLCPSIPLPPPQWPDFFADLIVACNSVIARMERRQDEVDRQREQWLRRLLQEKTSPYTEQDGYHLGLPVEQGQLWILAWPSGSIQASQSVRNRMIAEDLILESLKSHLIFKKDEMAVVLLAEQAAQKPPQVRDTLIQHYGVYPL